MNLKDWIPTVLAFLSLFVFCQTLPAKEPVEELATVASEVWLALADKGEYAASWNEAAELFRAAMTEEQWRATLSAFRKPLGKVLSRRLKLRRYTETLPGAPDGQYVVIQYETVFEHKKFAIETVTPMLDRDGTWRVAGYYIK
ncbi:MAG: DUF4019 domain-containing protein [Proteobacteria bacterium]|nr:DUF4019 domain-containing protein [Pseudomonadota bacterium]